MLLMMKMPYKDLEMTARTMWSGLMVGDALGAPAEFNYKHDVLRRFPDGLDKMVQGFVTCRDRQAGEVTDDTQMAWCLHQSLLDAGGWSPAAAMERYQEWFASDPPDVGHATKMALMGTPLLESQGNGTLMRVMPLALWAAQHPDFDWRTAAREDAALTHPHPHCAASNEVYIYALLLAMKEGSTPQGVYAATLQWATEQGIAAPVVDTLRRAATERPDYDGPHIGWVLIALQNAFYQLLHARDFRSSLVDIVSSGGDTDTNAAIAGPLLAAIYGPHSIPRDWLVCVRAVNQPRYTMLMLRRKDTPCVQA